jgi:hypothetical protein
MALADRIPSLRRAVGIEDWELNVVLRVQLIWKIPVMVKKWGWSFSLRGVGIDSTSGSVQGFRLVVYVSDFTQTADSKIRPCGGLRHGFCGGGCETPRFFWST